MRIVGVRRPDDGAGVEVAALADDGTKVTVIASLTDFWADPAGYLSRPPAGPALDATAVEQVPPVLPDARVFCIGLNYLQHAAEGSFRDQELPPHPTLFARWTQSLTVDGAHIPVPSNEDGLDWEGEVVAWIGTPLVDATPRQALAAVIGYSAFNDLTSRKAQKLTSQWILGKNGDHSGPLGPMVPATETGDLSQGLRLRTRVNGETVQDARTDQMIYTVGDTLSLISHTLTLRPGDILATGTPAGVGYARQPPQLLQPGDTVEVEVERLGTVRNTIVDNHHRTHSHAPVIAKSLNEEEHAMSEQDKAQIIEIMNLYGLALDAHQWGLFDRIFTEDVVAEFGPAGAAWRGLETFKRSFAEFHETLDGHQHTMMGHLVHVDGDKAHAFSYGNWLLVREAAEDGSTWEGTGWYDDELVRTENGWRIQRRVCRLMSWKGNPLVPEPNGEHNPDMQLNVLRKHSEAGKIEFLKAIGAQ